MSVSTITFTVTHIYLLTTFLQTSFPYLVLYFDVKKHDMELCLAVLGAGLPVPLHYMECHMCHLAQDETFLSVARFV